MSHANIDDLGFTSTHEWVRVKGKIIVVGVTEHVARRLHEVVNLELPEPDEHAYEAEEEVGTIEASSTSIEFHAPVSGVITAVNHELLSKPELIRDDPYDKGWLFKMRPDSMDDVDGLMDIDSYEENVPEVEEDEPAGDGEAES